MKTYISILLLLVVTMSATGQKTEHAYDSTLARQLGADERGMKMYVLVVLKTGPAEISDKALRDSLFVGHFSNMEKLAAEKKLILAGPMAENDKQYRGLFLFDVKTIEEAEELLKGDPTVTSKIFDTELYQWYGSAALPVYLEAAERITKNNP
jgi:uncharacterized protein YciI